jgi:subtilisin family serine protease
MVFILLALLARPSAAEEAVARPAAARQVLVLLRLPSPHLRGGQDYGDAYDDAAGHAARRRIAADLARRHGLTLAQDWPMPLLGVDCYVMIVPGTDAPETIVQALANDRRVAWAQPMAEFHGQGAAQPNDPLFPLQPAARVWRLAALHQLATGRRVSVAVIDSGVDAGHPDLAGQVVDRQDFVGGAARAETHGTGVAGVIAAVENNGVGIAGVAPHARLMALRACWERSAADTVCNTLSLAEALHYAVDHGAQVINLSLSGPDDRLLGQLVDVALARGVTVVGAADPARADGGFPASHRGVVGVSAETLASAGSGFYTAPGRDVPTTAPGARWTLVNGSSFAAAHVSGLFALLRERSANARGGTALVGLGGGAIDACATLIRATGPCDCDCAHPAPAPTAAGRR